MRCGASVGVIMLVAPHDMQVDLRLASVWDRMLKKSIRLRAVISENQQYYPKIVRTSKR